MKIDDPRKLPEDIRDKYPLYDQDALREAIEQMEENIRLMEATIEKELKKKSEYRALIALCDERDAELASRGIVDV